MSYKPRYITSCPFYQSEGEKVIICEGVGTAKNLKMVFEDEQTKFDYEKKHCCKCNPEGCDIYKLLVKKYV